MNQTLTRFKVQDNHGHDTSCLHLIDELPKSVVEISVGTYGGLHAENCSNESLFCLLVLHKEKI